MLKLFRQRKLAIRILLFLIVGLVGFMMVVTLVPGLSNVDLGLQDPQGVLARVDDVPITPEEAREEFRRRLQQLGGSAPQLQPFLMRQVVDDLVTQRALEFEANRLGLEAPPEEVQARLRQISLLYPGGRFVGLDAYRAIVQSQMGLTIPQFEHSVRRQLLIDKLAMWVTAGVGVAPGDIEQEYRRQNETARIEYVEFVPASYANQVRPSQEDLAAYFQANLARYQQPERRSVRYVAIDFDELSRRTTVPPQDLEDYYRRNLDDYRLPDRVRARHILFLRNDFGTLTPDAATPAEEGDPDALRQEAEQVLEQLRRGAGFAALAREHSDDQATSQAGGEIGWVQRGQTVPELERVLFSLPSGGDPELVETSYGFHIVQVMERENARVRSLAEVRSEIEPVLRQQIVQREALVQARRIAEATRSGKTLDQAAKEAGWPVLETPLFTRTETIPQFGGQQDFQETAFRLQQSAPGSTTAAVSDPVALPAGYAVMQLNEVVSAHEATFEEVRGQVERAYRAEKAAEQARQAAEKLAAEVEAGADWLAAVRRAGLSLKNPEPFARSGAVPGLGSVREIASQAFSLPVGSVSPAVAMGGKWLVFRVVDRQEVALDQIPPEMRDTLRDSLLQQKRRLAWTIFTESLRKRLEAEGKLELNEAAIERITSQA